MTALTTELGVNNIQHQVDNCDTIVNNIDLIVSKLYKIRQQALAQKEYINDATRLLVSRNDFITGFKSLNYNTTHAAHISVFNGTSAKPGNLEKFVDKDGDTDAKRLQRHAIQSLIQYKHDCGTSTHFTSDQIGTADNRTNGLSLADVVGITAGLNDFLKHSDVTATVLNQKIFLKKKAHAGVVPTDGDVLVGADVNAAASVTTYKKMATPDGIESLHVEAALNESIISFGLAD